jgi:hypothetical protein
MTTELKWTRLDKKHARAVLKQLADHLGGWQAMADAMDMTADSSRATVQAWHGRGRVPVAQLPAVIKLLRDAGIECTASELSPQARQLEAITHE